MIIFTKLKFTLLLLLQQEPSRTDIGRTQRKVTAKNNYIYFVKIEKIYFFIIGKNIIEKILFIIE